MGGELRRGALAALVVWVVLTAIKWLAMGGAVAPSAKDATEADREAALLRASGQRPSALAGHAQLEPCTRAGELVDDSVYECEAGCSPPRCADCACRACAMCASRLQPATSAASAGTPPIEGGHGTSNSGSQWPILDAGILADAEERGANEEPTKANAEQRDATTEERGAEAQRRGDGSLDGAGRQSGHSSEGGEGGAHEGKARLPAASNATSGGGGAATGVGIGGHSMAHGGSRIGAIAGRSVSKRNSSGGSSGGGGIGLSGGANGVDDGDGSAVDSKAGGGGASSSGFSNMSDPIGGGGLALGVLTQSRASERWKALEETWISSFPKILVVESHVDVSRVQQIWKYVPQRLYSRFPSADWYLIIDDDVFINVDRLRAFTAARDPTQLALYGPGFCEWGVPAKVMAKAGALLGIDPMPPAVHIVIGGIMLFTVAAVKKFADPDNVLKCIDDLETLYSNGVKLWGGLKESALYNQDWLFCWCMQVRLGGQVLIGDANAFEDIDFPTDKCMTVAGAARTRVGIHHVDPRRMRALWRAHLRSNRTSARLWPAGTSRGCAVNSRGNPAESHPVRDYRTLDSLVKLPGAERCRSIVSFPEVQAAHPSCMLRMARLKQKPQDSPCHGGMGHARCAGFQLDVNDNCNLQYALFCDALYRPSGKQRCPSPHGYPQHCCYDRALDEMADEAANGTATGGGAGRKVRPQQHLLQVFPGEPVFGRPAGKGKGGGGPGRGASGKPPRMPGRRLLEASPQSTAFCAYSEGGQREVGHRAAAGKGERQGCLQAPHSLRAQESYRLHEPLPRTNATAGGSFVFPTPTAAHDPSLESARAASWRQ